jgi:hypothetical protein
LSGVYTSVATADWTGDGHLDLLAGDLTPNETKLFVGRGDGTFADPVAIPEVLQAAAFGVADFDRDGHDDVAAGSYASHLTVLLADGVGGLRVGHQIPVGSPTTGLAIADFDLDGNLDIAAVVFGPPEVAVFFGRGDGTFGDRRSVPMPGGVFTIASADFDRDGRPDCVTMEFTTGAIHFLKGDGTGGFARTQVGVGPGETSALATVDWNGDGFEDFYAAGGIATRNAFFLGDGAGHFTSFAPAGFSDAMSSVAFADFNEDGRPDFCGEGVDTYLNTTATVTGVAARAFPTNSNRTVPTNSSSASLSIRLEPTAGSFDVADVDPRSLRLVSEGTGSVGSIAAIDSKSGVVADLDKNGIEEYPATFAMADVSTLYDRLRGRHDVSPNLEGSLLQGGRFCASVALTIIATGSGPGVARVDPNPLNPEGVLRFTTLRPSPVTVRLFDVNGRLVRTLWNRRASPTGLQEVRIDGRDQQGKSLGSGIYFYRIQGDELNISGRFTVLK